MDKIASWFLFWLCFIAAIAAANRILGDLQERSTDLVSMDQWVAGHTHEIEAEKYMKNSSPREAMTEMDEAIEIIERLKKDKPAFRPNLTNDWLIDLKEKRDAIRSGRYPISQNPLSPAESSPSIEIPTIGNPVDLAVVDPLSDIYKSSLIDLPEIGSADWEMSASPGVVKWEKATLPLPDETHFSTRSGYRFPNQTNPVSVSLNTTRSDPSSIWYRAFSSARQAKQLEANGDRANALQKYEESKTCYDILNRDFPEFESPHIKNGSELLADKLNKMIGIQ